MEPVSFASLAQTRIRQAKGGKPQPIAKGTMELHKGDFVEMRIAMKEAFIKVRGEDKTPPTSGKVTPATTNEDVISVLNYWSKAMKQWGGGGSPAAMRRWRKYIGVVEHQTKGKPDADVFGDNDTFWNVELARAAIHLNSLQGQPSKWDYAWESVKESVVELPGTLVSVGKIAVAPIKGAAEGLGLTLTNLLLGAAVVVGAAAVVTKTLK